MAGLARKPFQGVLNIVRFNWHFYVIVLPIIVIAVIGSMWLNLQLHIISEVVSGLALLSILISLVASYYIYDLSNLYSLDWLDKANIEKVKNIVNINAGFDETSTLLAEKFPNPKLVVFDFYDPTKHTEVSIERARKAYPPYPNTKLISTNAVPLEPNSVDCIFLILAAHEIRNNNERAQFLSQLTNALTNQGSIIVVEHLRDFNNFIVYNIGAFHFLSKATWNDTFLKANLITESETKLTPFISIFKLRRNGNPS